MPVVTACFLTWENKCVANWKRSMYKGAGQRSMVIKVDSRSE